MAKPPWSHGEYHMMPKMTDECKNLTSSRIHNSIMHRKPVCGAAPYEAQNKCKVLILQQLDKKSTCC